MINFHRNITELIIINLFLFENQGFVRKELEESLSVSPSGKIMLAGCQDKCQSESLQSVLSRVLPPPHNVAV